MPPKRRRQASPELSHTAKRALGTASKAAKDTSVAAAFKQVSRPELEQYRLDLGHGADVLYQPNFLTDEEAGQWYADLVALDTYHPTLKLYGKEVVQSRSIAAYSTTEQPLKYSGASIEVHSPFPAALEAMRVKVQTHLGVEFNHVLLNRYDDGSVYIGRHSDTKDNGVIASISVGAERTFVMSPRLPARNGPLRVGPELEKELATRKNHKWSLANGSLVVMQGQTQDFWKHEIPREPAVKKGRISLTFRQLF